MSRSPVLRACRIAAVLAASLAAVSPAAAADLFGSWKDNANPALQIGRLDVTASEVRIGRKAAYPVRMVRQGGSGVVLQVTGQPPRHDAFGCGPEGRVTYIVLQPLPAIAGFDMQAMRLVFYGGDRTPDLATLETDRAVCEMHPYGRMAGRSPSALQARKAKR